MSPRGHRSTSSRSSSSDSSLDSAASRAAFSSSRRLCAADAGGGAFAVPAIAIADAIRSSAADFAAAPARGERGGEVVRSPFEGGSKAETAATAEEPWEIERATAATSPGYGMKCGGGGGGAWGPERADTNAACARSDAARASEAANHARVCASFAMSG